MSTQKIMVAVDFGTTSLRAVESAIDLARQLGASLDIVHVSPRMPFRPTSDDLAPDDLEDARGELELLEARAQQANVEVATHLRQESIVTGILDAIQELRPRLVVVGSHGRSGFPRALLGSVAETIARRSSVPVLIVPSHEREKQALTQAWSCRGCGHILVDGESNLGCSRCGESPAYWSSAPIGREPPATAKTAG
jgi:nucleotide-binding universal stress UspA family protein